MDTTDKIAEALTKLQWRRGFRGFAGPGGPGGRSGGPGGRHGRQHGGPFGKDGLFGENGPFGDGGPFGDSGPFGKDGPFGSHFTDTDGPGHGETVGRDEWREWARRLGGRLGGRAQLRLLIALAQVGHAIGVSALGEAIGVDQPRASRLVAQGVELDLLRREADPDDARRTLIALTDKGRAITNRFLGAQKASVDVALDSFTDEEKETLANLLTRLADAWPK
ncbi:MULTISPECIES: MarR family winged helix-turn-helix transcriptional regulator [Brevibacterium]|uniref:MarR family winged helix-turn-helix transcriptional regulator n=1 Tax=Brevibacterium TaxID=1696 RepID=UPI001E42858B|nr:MarR family winged helix-turn-helix transcriptional regulator [Brevibacterium casei]